MHTYHKLSITLTCVRVCACMLSERACGCVCVLHACALSFVLITHAHTTQCINDAMGTRDLLGERVLGNCPLSGRPAHHTQTHIQTHTHTQTDAHTRTHRRAHTDAHKHMSAHACAYVCTSSIQKAASHASNTVAPNDPRWTPYGPPMAPKGPPMDLQLPEPKNL